LLLPEVPARQNSGNIQELFGEHSGNIQGTFREHSKKLHVIFPLSPRGWLINLLCIYIWLSLGRYYGCDRLYRLSSEFLPYIRIVIISLALHTMTRLVKYAPPHNFF
jgi:hypothetical protein